MVDHAKLQNFITEHHPNAHSLNAVPERFKGTFMVREVWVGNIAQNTEKQGLFEAFKHFGEIEGVEMFSTKGFAFVKFRKVIAATKAYEFGEGTLVEGRSVKITFADPSRRQDIVGDSPVGENGNESVPDDGVRSLVLEYPSDGFVPGEGILKEVCSRYGVVKRICIRQGSGNYRPHAFVDFERGSQAAEARKKLYIEDYDGSKRRELGHPAIDISFKNTNNIVNKNVPKPVPRPEPTSEVSQLARKLLEQPAGYLNLLKFQPGSVFPPMVNPNLFSPSIPHSSIPPSARVPLVNNQISKSEPNPVSPPVVMPPVTEANPSIGTVVWSGFMTRSKKCRVGIDATLVQGNDDCFPSSLYHINISHRVQLSEITKYFIIALVTIEASNETQQELFDGYLKYFSSKERAGYISMKTSVLYICPPIHEAKKLYPEIKDTQLLGVFLDTTKKPEKSKDPHLEEILRLLQNPEALKHSETIAQFIK
jgi:RNA recognition motif-containing protein